MLEAGVAIGDVWQSIRGGERAQRGLCFLVLDRLGPDAVEVGAAAFEEALAHGVLGVGERARAIGIASPDAAVDGLDDELTHLFDEECLARRLVEQPVLGVGGELQIGVGVGAQEQVAGVGRGQEADLEPSCVRDELSVGGGGVFGEVGVVEIVQAGQDRSEPGRLGVKPAELAQQTRIAALGGEPRRFVEQEHRASAFGPQRGEPFFDPVLVEIAGATNGKLLLFDPDDEQASVSSVTLPLADNLAISSRNEIFVSSGETGFVSKAGVEVYVVGPAHTLQPVKTYLLGVNAFSSSSGRPRNDQIRRIILKE